MSTFLLIVFLSYLATIALWTAALFALAYATGESTKRMYRAHKAWREGRF